MGGTARTCRNCRNGKNGKEPQESCNICKTCNCCPFLTAHGPVLPVPRLSLLDATVGQSVVGSSSLWSSSLLEVALCAALVMVLRSFRFPLPATVRLSRLPGSPAALSRAELKAGYSPPLPL